MSTEDRDDKLDAALDALRSVIRERDEQHAREIAALKTTECERALMQAPRVRDVNAPMTADELIEVLSRLPPNDRKKLVSTEGCDCMGDVGSVSCGADEVVLNRTRRQ